MIVKAAASAADAVIIDLEDSVAAGAKAAARQHAREAMHLDWHGKSLGVRVNGFGTAHLLEDLEAVLSSVFASMAARLDFVVLPKARYPEDVFWVGRYIDEFELRANREPQSGEPGRARQIGIELLVETPAGLHNAYDLASAHPRVEALVLGPVDYLASLGASSAMAADLEEALRGPLAHPRQSVLIAARAAGVGALDMAYPNIGDIAGLTRQARDAASFGYDGKWIIHPAQIQAVNEAFTPSVEEVSRARSLLESAAAASATGAGAFALAGEMFDEAHLRAARALLRREDNPEPQ